MPLLTDTYLRSLKPKAKRYKSRRERGLFLWIDPNNSRRWALSFTFAGKEDTLALGPYPAITLGEARGLRDATQNQIAHGINPKMARREAAAAAQSAVEHEFAAVVERWKVDELAQLSGFAPKKSLTH